MSQILPYETRSTVPFVLMTDNRRCRHARLLQQPEGLARIHRLQLRGVAHQRYARHTQVARDAQPPPCERCRSRPRPPPEPRPRNPPGPGPAAPGRTGRRSGSRSIAASARGCRPPWREPERRRPTAPPCILSSPRSSFTSRTWSSRCRLALHDHEIVRSHLAPGETRRAEGICALLTRPARINASTRRSARTARSVTKMAFRLDELAAAHKPIRVDLGQR